MASKRRADGDLADLARPTDVARPTELARPTDVARPRVAWWDPTDPAKRAAVASALAADPDGLPLCRDRQLEAIQAFLDRGSGVLSVCGVPGSGKTLAVTALARQWRDRGHRVVAHNGMRLPDLAQVLREIPGASLVVLDEVDAAPAAVRDHLRALARAPGSRLALIGMSNSLSSNTLAHGPEDTVVFPPYTSADITAVLEQRLAALPGPVFDPVALSVCGRKVAKAVSGDMRRALEACAVALAIHVDSPHDDNGVRMKHMAVALDRVTGGIGVTNAHVVAIRRLPVPQQLLMAALVRPPHRTPARGLHFITPSERLVSDVSVPGALPGLPGMAKRRRKETTPAGVAVTDLQAAHTALCRRVGVAPYGHGEFAAALDLLQASGLLAVRGTANAVHGKKTPRVVIEVAEGDVALALQDVPVLKHVVLN